MLSKLEDLCVVENLPKLVIVDKNGEVRVEDARVFAEKRDDTA